MNLRQITQTLLQQSFRIAGNDYATFDRKIICDTEIKNSIDFRKLVFILQTYFLDIESQFTPLCVRVLITNYN